MAKTYTVKARIEAEDRASNVLRGVESRFSRFGGVLKSALAIGAGAAVAAVGSLAFALRGSVDAASEAEDAAKRLNNALAPLGASAAGVSQALREQANALQQVTRFDDDAIVSGQALLAIYVQNEEQLKSGTQAAVDFAAATGTDISTAFKLIAKAAAGNTAALSRYGIILDENIPKGEKFAAVLSQVADTMGGRAAADAKTYSGALAILGNAFGELQETAGKAVTGSDRVKEALSALKDVLTNEGLIAAVRMFAESITYVGAVLASGIIDKINSLLGLLKPLGFAMSAAAGGATAFGLALTLVIEALVKMTSSLAGFLSGIPLIGSSFGTARDALDGFDDSLDATQQGMAKLALELAHGGLAAALFGDGIEKSGDAMAIAAAKSQQYIDSMRSSEAAVTSYGAALSPAIEGTDALGESELSAASNAGVLAGATAATSSALASAGAQAVITSQQFDALSDAMGRAAAVQAALAGGATTSQGGTRVRLGGFSDGSRLTSPAGGVANAGSTAAGGTFTAPIKRYYVDGMGRVVPF